MYIASHSPTRPVSPRQTILPRRPPRHHARRSQHNFRASGKHLRTIQICGRLQIFSARLKRLLTREGSSPNFIIPDQCSNSNGTAKSEFHDSTTVRGHLKTVASDISHSNERKIHRCGGELMSLTTAPACELTSLDSIRGPSRRFTATGIREICSSIKTSS